MPARRPRRRAGAWRGSSHTASRPGLARLRTVPRLRELPETSLAVLDAFSCEADVPAGTELLREQAPGRQVLVVVEGIAALSSRGRLIAHAGPGEIVGGLALLGAPPAPAVSAAASTPMRVLVLEPRQFAALFDEPGLARWIAATLALGADRRIARDTAACA